MDIRDLFLAAMKAALEGTEVVCDQEVSVEEWEQFFKIAREHNVIPMVYQSIYSCEAFRKTGAGLVPLLKRTTMNAVFMQIQKTQEFLKMYRFLASKGLEPIVVKGIVVRMLHPNPDYRTSGDEDLYIPAGTYDIYKAALNEYGMQLAEWDVEKEDTNHEVTYISPGGILNVEIHKDLFDAKLSAYKGMNSLFTNAFEGSILLDIDGNQIRTMNHSDHMLFLILHAFKHFVSSGFGIRQVCDMVVYGNHYGKDIDWKYLLDKCKEINADLFAAAIFDIGHRYLGFDYQASGFSREWQQIRVDSEALLNDLIDAGIFGAADMSRKHSSNMTLSAVSAQKEGKTAKNSLLKTLFPSVAVLEGRFTYLQKYPFLLPVAWAQRIWTYRKETAGNKGGNNAAESIKIGNERVELMRQYGIIK